MNMKKIPLKERILLIFLIGSAVAFAIWLVYFSPISETDGTDIFEEQPTGEETGVTGLIPLSCTKIKGIYTYTFYDPETGVMYYLVKDDINASTASGSGVLENPDGTPRIYTPYQKDSGD